MALIPFVLTFEASNLITVCTSKFITFSFLSNLFLTLHVRAPNHFWIRINFYLKFNFFKFQLIRFTKLLHNSLIWDLNPASPTSAIEFPSRSIFVKLCDLVCTEALFTNNCAPRSTSHCLFFNLLFHITNIARKCFCVFTLILTAEDTKVLIIYVLVFYMLVDLFFFSVLVAEFNEIELERFDLIAFFKTDFC